MWYCLSPLPVTISCHHCLLPLPIAVFHCWFPVASCCHPGFLPQCASPFDCTPPPLRSHPPLGFSIYRTHALYCTFPSIVLLPPSRSASILLLPPLRFSLHCCHCLSRPSSHPMLPKPLLSLVSAVPRRCHCCCCLSLSPVMPLSLVVVTDPAAITHHCCHCHFHCH